MSHPKPTAGAVKQAAPKPAAVADKPAVLEKGPEPAVVAKPRLAFSLILTVVAVLPVAMGVGAARLKASASATNPLPVSADSEKDNKESSYSSADRRVGDELFIKRRYDLALRHYQSLGSGDAARLPAELLYRCALCEEGLGKWSEAIEHLMYVADAPDQPELKAAAVFGQARVWMRKNEPAKAASLLRHLVLRSEIQNSIPANMSREIAFLIPLSLAKSTTFEVHYADRADPAYQSQFFNGSLEKALEWADQPLHDVTFAADAHLPDNACRMRWKRTSREIVGAQPLEAQIVEVCCRHQSLRTIVQTIADQCGWNIDWSDLPQDPSLNRVVSVVTEGQPLCVVLTVICSEMQSTWTITDDRLIIARSHLKGEDARGMISRSLMSVAKWMPNDRYVDDARFALAEIAQAECCLSDAANLFAAIAGSNSSPMAIRAAANAADNYYRLRDYPSACTQLLHVVDGGPGTQVQAESLVLLGRLQLDMGLVQDAIFQLRRATDVNNSHDVQSRASILLGLAYLLQDKYQEAAEAVFVRKYQFEDPEARNAAAFVTSFARWKFSNAEARERESTFLYRAVISTNPDLEWIGQTGRLMIGRGYLELGFGDEMAELYSRLLAGELTENIRDEVTFSLANYEMENDRSELAKRLWWKLSNGHSKRLASRSRMRLAAVALLEGRPKDCLEICELIQVDDEVSVMDIQRLMGRAFEQLGEDQLAARCYAGQYKRP